MVGTDGLRVSPRDAARQRWDLLVVGGGLVGAALLLEATRRGLSALLLERDDFGSQTSGNSLRLVHGGLRYLQRLDLARHHRSVLERARWLRDFPDFVSPLPCLLPLSGQGLERPAVLRLALAADRLLTGRTVRGLGRDHLLPSGRILEAAATREQCPLLGERSLVGGALWWDAQIVRPQRLLMEMLRWAVSGGAVALNRVEARSLETEGRRIRGLLAFDHTRGQHLTFRAERVVNAAGPWCREVATRFDPIHAKQHAGLFRPSLALNLLLDRSLGPSPALALAPSPGAARLFFVPWRGQLLAGTHHAALPPGPSTGEGADRSLRESLDRGVDDFLADLDRALPALRLERDAVRHIFWGRLPATAEGGAQLARRPVVLDHGREGGPEGLVSVSGLKLTTARQLAREALDLLGTPSPRRLSSPLPRPTPAPWPTAAEAAGALETDPAGFGPRITELAAAERVHHPDDLLYRRTGWGHDPEHHSTLGPWIAGLVPSA